MLEFTSTECRARYEKNRRAGALQLCSLQVNDHFSSTDLMALLSIKSLRSHVLRLLARTRPPAGIELLSYKRDRSIIFICLQEGGYRVIERGFVQQDCIVEASALSRLLKTLIRREFPRSHKVRLLKFSSMAGIAEK